MERMTREFTVDDHKYWAKDEDDEKQARFQNAVLRAENRKRNTALKADNRKK